MDEIKFIKCRDVKTPTRSYIESVGYDFYIPNDVGWEYMKILPGDSMLIPSGIKINLPTDFAFIADSRSSTGKMGLIPGARVIDPGYQGEIHISLCNVSNREIVIRPEDRLVQFLLFQCFTPKLVEVKEFEDESIRGTKGLGSSGR